MSDTEEKASFTPLGDWIIQKSTAQTNRKRVMEGNQSSCSSWDTGVLGKVHFSLLDRLWRSQENSWALNVTSKAQHLTWGRSQILCPYKSAPWKTPNWPLLQSHKALAVNKGSFLISPEQLNEPEVFTGAKYFVFSFQTAQRILPSNTPISAWITTCVFSLIPVFLQAHHLRV